MSQTYDVILKGGTVVNQDGRVQRDLGVTNGKIVALGDLSRASAGEVVDCTGLHILPGVIDSQVHFREPGLDHKEDLETGSRAAVLGGVTTVFEMPNTIPQTTDPAALADKIRRGRHRMHCDFAFWVGGTHENVKDVPELERLPGAAGIKVFMGSSTGSMLVAYDATLERVLAHGRRRVAVHCEDEQRLIERRSLIPATGAHVRMHPLWRDEETALRATTRLLRASARTRRRIHVLHVTTADEMALLREHKDLATVEVLPQHLTLSAPECYERLGTYAQMNPPIRDARHQAALWAAVRDGTVDVLGSDHAPHTRAEKDKPYPESPSGLTGVQTLLPLMLDHVAKGRLTLERLVDLTSAAPQRVFGLVNKGRIALGYDADLTLVDLKATRTIEHRWIASRVGWTPFDGMTVTGWPVATIIRGHTVMRDDQLIGTPIGGLVRFDEAL
jgi:dihydroorotase